MAIITRLVNVSNYEKYEVEINEIYIEDINRYLRDNLVYPENFEPLTVEDVISLYRRDGSNIRSEYLLELKIPYASKPYTQTLEDFVWNWVDSSIWDNYVETVDSEYGDYEDTIDV